MYVALTKEQRARRDAFRQRRQQAQRALQAELGAAPPAPQKGGLGISPGGRGMAPRFQEDSFFSPENMGKMAGKQALKSGAQVLERSGVGTSQGGRSEDAYQSQRSGERADYTSALSGASPNSTPATPGFSSLDPGSSLPPSMDRGFGLSGYGSGSEYVAPEIDYGSMLPSSSGIAPGAEAGADALGSSAGSALGGMGAGLGTGVAAAIPILQSLYNISQGANAGNAMAGAAGSLIQAAPALYSQMTGAAGGGLMSGIGAIPGIWEMANDLLGGYNPQETRGIKRDFNTAWEPYKSAIGTPAKVAGATDPQALRTFLENANYQLAQAPAVSRYISTMGGMNAHEAPQDLTDILPYSQQASTDSALAYTLAMDKLAKQGLVPEMGTGEGQSNISDVWSDPRSMVGAMWGSSNAENNWDDRTKWAEALGLAPRFTSRWNYGGPSYISPSEEGSNTYTEKPTRWDLTPEQLQALSAPGTRMEALRELFGGLNPDFAGSPLGREFSDLGYGGPVGNAQPVGGVNPGPGGAGGMNPEQVGGAGKLSPNFITPELDLRQAFGTGVGEAGRRSAGGFGVRGATPPPAVFGMNQNTQSTPVFGMWPQQNPNGGFAVPGGGSANAPFGVGPARGTLQTRDTTRGAGAF